MQLKKPKFLKGITKGRKKSTSAACGVPKSITGKRSNIENLPWKDLSVSPWFLEHNETIALMPPSHKTTITERQEQEEDFEEDFDEELSGEFDTSCFLTDDCSDDEESPRSLPQKEEKIPMERL